MSEVISRRIGIASRRSGIIGLLLLVAGVLGVVFSLAYAPAHGAYSTTITSVRTVYETTMVWTDPLMHVAGGSSMLLGFLAAGYGLVAVYRRISPGKQALKT